MFLNAVFGLIYFLLPEGELEGLHQGQGFARFLENFFFSVQTFGTIGYGRISPVGTAANLVVTLECYLSLCVVAVLTGLIFARFARPNAKVIFSNQAVIRKFDGIPCFMFRMANARQNYVTDARVNVSIAMDDIKSGYRQFTTLKLERESTPIFALSWTIAHDIDETSPLYGLTMDEWRNANAEVVVTFSGVDTTLSQLVHAKSSYIADEIVFDSDFEDVLVRNKKGAVELKLEKFHLIKRLS